MARKKKRPGKPDYRMAYFFFVLGAISFVLGAWAAINGVQTLRWPSVQAEIVAANLQLHETERRDQRSPDRRHTFAVAYVYAVDGQRYLSHGIEPEDFGMQNSGDAVKLANVYPVGSKAQVVYDPANPAMAYLKPGPSSFSLMLLGIGVAFALAGGLARRMIRVGPGEDEDESENAPPVTSKTEIDPEIAGYYPKPDDKQAAR
jgi:flagellar basal body rod protein FlgC